MNESELNTREPQYKRSLELAEKNGLTPLGLMTNQAWQDDPKHLLFTMSRYKFVSKLLEGRKNVLEVGCADAWCTRLVIQSVNKVTALDFDPVFVSDVSLRMDKRWKFDVYEHDLLSGPFYGEYDAAYALDVIEHIQQRDEIQFIKNIVNSLTDQGSLILGCPTLQSQLYASPASKAGHVNCKTNISMRELLSQFYHNVFIFSMNDEVVHTGYGPMAHYIFGLGCSKKETV